MKELYTEPSLEDEKCSLECLINLDATIIDAKLSQLESLNSEIRFEGCKTVAEVVELINNDIVLLNKMKIEKGIK